MNSGKLPVYKPELFPSLVKAAAFYQLKEISPKPHLTQLEGKKNERLVLNNCNLSQLVLFRTQFTFYEMECSQVFLHSETDYVQRSSFNNVEFVGSVFRGNFKQSTFIKVQFLLTDLTGGNFKSAVFRDCSFWECSFASELEEVTFENCKFSEIKSETSFRKCTFKNSNHTIFDKKKLINCTIDPIGFYCID
jgi:uncharacterized protein YjbI with pentapeptide repeats